MKTNEELKEIIRNSGCDETKLDNADIERLISENEKMRKIIRILEVAFYVENQNQDDRGSGVDACSHT